MLLWLLEVSAAELVSASIAAGSSAGIDGDAAGMGGEGAEDEAGAAAAIELLKGVFERCMSSSKGVQLLGKHLGPVVEKLVSPSSGGSDVISPPDETPSGRQCS